MAKKNPVSVDSDHFRMALVHMARAIGLANWYEENKEVCSKYVHATSRGHEAVQIAAGMLLKPQDFVFPYYRDDAMLLAMGFSPEDLMRQLLAKGTDYFSGGRTYYAHPSSTLPDKPKIPHQSSATGMQVIPATGAAQGLLYKRSQGLIKDAGEENPIVLCSLGDGAMTEGEISEALQMAVLHRYPIVYLVQDNEWDISAHAREVRAQDAAYFARGFKGLQVESIDGTDFEQAYDCLKNVFLRVRQYQGPVLVHAKVPLLNHHTSGVRKEWYRPEADIQAHQARDPLPIFTSYLIEQQIHTQKEIEEVMVKAQQAVHQAFQRAQSQPEPEASSLTDHIFADSPVKEEGGIRSPVGSQPVVMVDAALHAVDEILKKHPEALLYGQDVGGALGGVFREAATLAQKYGEKRVFNTPIQEAYIIGSTVGMSATGCKPIVEVQFADYIFPGINQLFTEVSRSCYLSNGKWPVQAVYRVPIGAYGSGGPYHSSSVESFVLQIKGVKAVYPSNAADMKGLMKAAFLDPNPVVIFEHKGLYWSKVPGTQEAKCPQPDENYIIPLGKARWAQQAASGEEAIGIITYGMGVHWALQASATCRKNVDILDLRSLNPLDEEAIETIVKKNGKLLILTEETVTHSFAEALAGRIASKYFTFLDAPIRIIGAVNTPAIPLNSTLEKAMLPNAEIVKTAITDLLQY
jgi:2-oxoisovalerate dehydrogenase E1 component